MTNPPYAEPPHFPEDDLERYEAVAALAGLSLPEWLEQATGEVRARRDDSSAVSASDDGARSEHGESGTEDEARLAALATELGLRGEAADVAKTLARRYRAAPTEGDSADSE